MTYFFLAPMEEIMLIKKHIIQKLIRGNVWGGKHTPLDLVIKGIPEHYRNTHQGMRTVKKALKELLNDGFVIVLIKRTGKGADNHVSLNPRKVAEIKQFIENLSS